MAFAVSRKMLATHVYPEHAQPDCGCPTLAVVDRLWLILVILTEPIPRDMRF